MKKLLYSLAVLLAVCINCHAAAPPGYVPGDNLWSTNIYMAGGTGSNRFTPGSLSVYSTPVGPIPIVRLIGPGSLGSIQLDDATANTLKLFRHVKIAGDLDVSGTVTGSGLVFSVTNFSFATNAWFATNAPDTSLIVSSNVLAAALADTNLYKLAQSYYPTNLASTNTDMGVPYGDVNWVTNFYFPRVVNLSSTNYQTAVRMVHASPATAATIGFDTTITAVGTLRLTNYTVVTFFWNPSTPLVTNALCVPMY